MLQILHAVKQIHTKRKKAVLWQRPGTKPGTSFCQMYSCSPVQKTAFRPDSASGGRRFRYTASGRVTPRGSIP